MEQTVGSGDYRTGEAANVAFPSVLPSSPRRAVLMVAGAGRTAQSDTTGSVNPLVVRSLADSGFPVIGADFCGHGSAYWLNGAFTWGNPEAVAAQLAGRNYMAATPNSKGDKVYIFAGSMGVADALNFYQANPGLVLALALTLPLLDLNNLAQNDKGFIGQALSTGLDSSMNGLTLPQATINFNQTTGFSGLSMNGIPGAGAPGAGKVNIMTSNGWQVVTMGALANTGPGGNAQATGCSGGTGNMVTGGQVSQGYGASLVAAYGNAWPNMLSGAQLAANSPIVWTETAGKLTVPTRAWTSDNDFIATTTAGAQVWADAVAAAGGGNVRPTIISMGSVGHNSLALDAGQVAAWFQSLNLG